MSGTHPSYRIGVARLAQQYASIRDEIDEAIARVTRRAMFSPADEVAAFEDEFARFVGARHAIAVGSGSDALMVALIGIGLERGDEVISVPNVDVSASAPITHAGGRIVWIDIDPATFNMDAGGLEARIGPRTRAVIPVHMYGNPADMDRIGAIAARHGLAVIEDAALALGATYGGKGVGSIGSVGCFSFSPFKILGAFGQGGMVVTDDTAIAHRVRLYSDHGLEPACLDAIRRGVAGARFVYLVEGYNGHLDELQAAVLRVKLRHLPRWQRQRVAHARLYREMLADLEPEHIILPTETPHAQAIYRVFVIRTRARDALLDHLARAGIYGGVHYIPPLHLQPAYRHLGLGTGAFPNTERVADELLCLSTIPELSSTEIEEVADTIRAFFQRTPAR